VASVLVGVLALAVEGPARAGEVAAAALLTALTMSAWARRVLGGRTGDTLGACVALVEVVVCLVILGAARP
jgi:adenosylcobinamide-GDP ribazoletransferase